MFDAKKKVARGELKLEDIPYMQRGGSWDNSDIKGAKKKRWLKEDKEYDERAAQSASIFGGENLPWNTKVRRRAAPLSIDLRERARRRCGARIAAGSRETDDVFEERTVFADGAHERHCR